MAGVVQALETSFGKGYYADKVLERLFKDNRQWGGRDRAFLAENVYGIVRWWQLLWFLYGKDPSLKRKELYRIFGVWWIFQGHDLPDWPQFEAIRNLELESRLSEIPQEQTHLKESYPLWLDQLAREQLGADWPPIAEALNEEAALMVRVNGLKIKRPELQARLREKGLPSQPLKISADGLKLLKRTNLFRNSEFKEGFMEVQDGGSQTIGPFLEVQPGERVIDACAGAGGKTLHLADLMNNTGQIIAMDVEAYKLAELKKRARRNAVHNVETRLIDSTKVIKRLHASADRLLLDVPCSGTGVIKRNPDTKWKLQPEHIERTRKLQRNILTDYPAMLKVGGVMVYATCSVLRSENEDQIAWFLTENKDFSLIEEKRISPGPESDGFYMARLLKKG
mgnify:CR=1 FL=1